MMIQYARMRKLVNEKRDELKQMNPKALVDRICGYPDQTLLNQTEEGQKRPFPVGDVARGIRDRQYQMSENQYYSLIHHFSRATVADLRVVGTTFRPVDPETAARFDAQPVGGSASDFTAPKTGQQVYGTTFHLVPEPENPYDPNAVKVEIPLQGGGREHIGYLSRDFVAAHPIRTEREAPGELVDFSNGHWKNLSYRLSLDVEALDQENRDALTLTESDLLGLEMPPVSEADEQPQPHTYETHFSLTDYVNDFDTAKAYLEEADMTSVLKEDEGLDASFRSAVTSINWVLEDWSSGVIRVETDRELSPQELQDLSRWVSGQNSDGLGEGFEQQPFASYEQELDYGTGLDYEEEADTEFIMASFDWEDNEYLFHDINEVRELPDLSVSDAELDALAAESDGELWQ